MRAPLVSFYYTPAARNFSDGTNRSGGIKYMTGRD